MIQLFFDLFCLLLISNDVGYDFVDHVVRKIVFVDLKNFHHDLLLLFSIFLVYWKMMNDDDEKEEEENCHVVFVI